MNFDQLNKMDSWERRRSTYLMNIAGNHLSMDLSCYGEIGVNEYSGNVYIWLGDYNFSLFMPINCELRISDIYVLYSCPIDGEETAMRLSEFNNMGDIEEWIDEMVKESEEKEVG